MKGYTSIEKIEKYKGITIDEDEVEDVEEYIEAVEEYIDHETNRDFTPITEETVETTRVYDGDGTHEIVLDGVKDLSAIRFSADGDPIDEDAYYLYPANEDVKTRIVLRGYVFPKGMQNISITGKFGMLKVPRDIRFAATALAAGIMPSVASEESAEGEIQSLSIGRYSVTYRQESAASKDIGKIPDILAYHRRYTF
jgi:hypothetical protein